MVRIHLPMQGTWVRSLVRDLRSHKLQRPTPTEHTSSVAQVLQLESWCDALKPQHRQNSNKKQPEKQNQKTKLRYREQIGGCQRWGLGGGRNGEGGQKVQTFSY